MGEMLTAVEVAERMGVSPVTVQRWARSGLLPGAELRVEAGRATWRIPAEALDDFERPRPGPPPGKR